MVTERVPRSQRARRLKPMLRLGLGLGSGLGLGLLG